LFLERKVVLKTIGIVFA